MSQETKPAETLYTPPAAARYLGVSGITLDRWAHRLWIKLVRGPDATRGRPPAGYYRQADLDRIREAQATREDRPVFPGLVPVEDARAEIGVSAKTFQRLQRRAGGIGKSVPKLARRKDGRAGVRKYVTRKFVEWAKDQRRAAVPDGRMSVAEAAAELGVTVATVHTWIRNGRGLSRVPPTPRAIMSRGGYPREGVQVWRSQVEALKKKRAAALARAAELRDGWEDVATIAHRHGVRHRTNLDRALRQWQKEGKLRSERVLLQAKDGHFRVVRLYDAAAVDQLLSGRVKMDGACPVLAAESRNGNLDSRAGIPPLEPRTHDDKEAHGNARITSFGDMALDQLRQLQSSGAAAASHHSGEREEARKDGKKQRIGRPPSDFTARLKERCYQLYYGAGLKMPLVLRALRDEFREEAPVDESHVRLYARRYAREKGLPQERHTSKNTGKTGGNKTEQN